MQNQRQSAEERDQRGIPALLLIAFQELTAAAPFSCKCIAHFEVHISSTYSCASLELETATLAILLFRGLAGPVVSRTCVPLPPKIDQG
ncbi:hypothetical protein TWF594_005270 [Orbilia oligospora]|nr:hypothetical protein TWF706_003677 [Orbilia oligospora]KAF3143209.1 hypothetical protein TWF594_005270 [Orbilia oligospora]